jgi:hypothetical protein
VDVIVAPGGAPVALAAKAAAASNTIVFEMGGDPVRLMMFFQNAPAAAPGPCPLVP